MSKKQTTVQNNILWVNALKSNLHFLFNRCLEVNKKSMKRVLSILLLSVMIPFVSFSQNLLTELIVGEKWYPPPSTLEEMVKNVKDMNANKAPKNEIASWMAKVIDWRITNMNSPERIFDLRNTFSGKGQELFDKWRDRSNLDNETSAKWAWNNSMGNCEENSNIVYYILKKAGVPKDFRQITTGKHQFTVWGLAPGADIGNPDTWGSNAIVVDPWLGKTVNSDGVKSGKWFQNGDPTIDLSDTTRGYDPDSEIWKTSAENRPLTASSGYDCFVATAAYGTPLAIEIQILREFRDKHMMKHEIGKHFIYWYESNGPKLAALLNRHPKLKPLVRQFIIQPIIYLIKNYTDESNS